MLVTFDVFFVVLLIAGLNTYVKLLDQQLKEKQTKDLCGVVSKDQENWLTIDSTQT